MRSKVQLMGRSYSDVDEYEIEVARVDDKYTWTKHDEKDTGGVVIGSKDEETGYSLETLLPRPDKRTSALIAWAGARHSRSPYTLPRILQEMEEKGVDPDSKLDATFNNYGHASVADMARLSVDFNNVPMHVAMNMFNYGQINGGQEKSTRYQKQFGEADLQDIEEVVGEEIPQHIIHKYEDLGKLSLEMFNKHKNSLKEKYTDFYRPEDKKEKKSLDSRVLDSARFFLLLGQKTGLNFETSARDYSNMISDFRGSSSESYRRLGEQLQDFLAPGKHIEEELDFKAQAPTLIRHTDPNTQYSADLRRLKDFLKEKNADGYLADGAKEFQGNRDQKVKLLAESEHSSAEIMVAQYLGTIFPGASGEEILGYMDTLEDGDKREISNIIFEGHTHHNPIPAQLGRTGGLSTIIECSLGEIRDFNRQRGCGRFIQGYNPLLGQEIGYDEASDIMKTGFSHPLYLDVPEMKENKMEFVQDMSEFYEKSFELMEDIYKEFGDDINYDFVNNILPLGHMQELWMHIDPKQASYFPQLRVRPGGHINYRMLAHDISKEVSESDPYLSALKVPKPNPADRNEFFNRS